MKCRATSSRWAVAIVLAFSAAGCGTSSTDDLVPEDEDFSAYEEELAAEGWMQFPEAIGDESEVLLRLTPKEPKAGEPVKVEVRAGSVYGRFHGKAWARVGEPGQHPEPTVEGWQELKQVGGQIMDLETGEMVPLGTTKEDPMDEQPGDTFYEVTLTFSEAGPAGLDLKFLYEYEGANPVAFQAWQGEVKAAD